MRLKSVKVYLEPEEDDCGDPDPGVETVQVRHRRAGKVVGVENGLQDKTMQRRRAGLKQISILVCALLAYPQQIAFFLLSIVVRYTRVSGDSVIICMTVMCIP